MILVILKMYYQTLFCYGIHYPIDIHDQVLKVYSDEAMIVYGYDDDDNPNRVFIYVPETQIYGTLSDKPNTYLNFYPIELHKIELQYKQKLIELNQIYDKLIKQIDSSHFHLGWTSYIVHGFYQ